MGLTLAARTLRLNVCKQDPLLISALKKPLHDVWAVKCCATKRWCQSCAHTCLRTTWEEKNSDRRAPQISNVTRLLQFPNDPAMPHLHTEFASLRHRPHTKLAPSQRSLKHLS